MQWKNLKTYQNIKIEEPIKYVIVIAKNYTMDFTDPQQPIKEPFPSNQLKKKK